MSKIEEIRTRWAGIGVQEDAQVDEDIAWLLGRVEELEEKVERLTDVHPDSLRAAWNELARLRKIEDAARGFIHCQHEAAQEHLGKLRKALETP